MTAIKLCGLTREEDIKKANEVKPEYEYSKGQKTLGQHRAIRHMRINVSA